MNAKYTLALVLTLMVSTSLCEVPTPSAKIVEEYGQLRARLYGRLVVIKEKVQEVLVPFLLSFADSEQTQTAKDYVEDMQSNPAFHTAVTVGTHLVQELTPVVEKLRTSMLGIYEHYLHSHIGGLLHNITRDAQPFLNTYLPTE